MSRKLAGFGAVVACAFASLDAPAQTPRAEKTGEVTLIGCVEMERDYRARKAEGRGGVFGSGVGVGNEFVLSNAKPPQPRGRATGAGAGVDYELTGPLEKDFLRHVGRQVEVVGSIEKAGEGIDRVNVMLWHPVGDYCPAVK